MSDNLGRHVEGYHMRIGNEIAELVRDIPGVAGLHIMAIHWAESVPEIVSRAGLYPRPDAKVEMAQPAIVDRPI
jgi:5,10-methylenetetrahydrofolate reductase